MFLKIVGILFILFGLMIIASVMECIEAPVMDSMAMAIFGLVFIAVGGACVLWDVEIPNS